MGNEVVRLKGVSLMSWGLETVWAPRDTDGEVNKLLACDNCYLIGEFNHGGSVEHEKLS